MKKDKLRGHDIVSVDDEWLYKDTMTPTVGNVRTCGYCGENDTKEGHDGCIGELPNIMNACCGHGTADEAYIQYLDGSCDTGCKALEEMAKLKENQ